MALKFSQLMLVWKAKLACCRDEALYSSTNGGSRYVFDPDYGGKVSMPKAPPPQPSRPDTTMSRHAPDASRPRALFADERSRYAQQHTQLIRRASRSLQQCCAGVPRVNHSLAAKQGSYTTALACKVLSSNTRHDDCLPGLAPANAC